MAEEKKLEGPMSSGTDPHIGWVRRCEEVLEPLKDAEHEANLTCDRLRAQLRRAQEEQKKARLARARAESELRLAQSYLRRSQNGGREEA